MALGKRMKAIREQIEPGKAYSIEPRTRQQYPDRGGQLTDGIAAARGWPPLF